MMRNRPAAPFSEQGKRLPRLRDEVLRAQLRPVAAIAICAGLFAVLAVAAQYFLIRESARNPVDELPASDIHTVFAVAPEAQWLVLVRWIAQYGLSVTFAPDSTRSNTNARVKTQFTNIATLSDGRKLPLYDIISLVRLGQRIDPLSGRMVGAAPAHWIAAAPEVGANTVVINFAYLDNSMLPTEMRDGDWKTALFRLNADTTLAISSPGFRLSGAVLAETIAMIFIVSFCTVAVFLALFLFIFRRRYAARSSERLVRPVERLASAVRAATADGIGSKLVTPESPMELAQLADDFNALQARLASSLLKMEQVIDAERSLVSEIAHELRTPLSVIRGHAEILSRDKKSEEHAEIIIRQVEDLHQLLSDLLDMARLESIEATIQLTPIDLNPIADEMVKRFAAPGWRKGVLVRKGNINAPANVAMADQRWLRQVLANLLANSIRHTAEGGLVELSIGQDEETAWLSVIDTGRGVEHFSDPREHLTRNAGIGLQLALRIMHAMGGGMHSQATGEGGTAVKIWLNLGLPVSSINDCKNDLR